MNNWQKNHVLKQITEFSFPLQMPTCSCSTVLIHRDPTILYLFIGIKQFLFSIYSIYITCSWHIFTLHVCIRALFQRSSTSIRFYLFCRETCPVWSRAAPTTRKLGTRQKGSSCSSQRPAKLWFPTCLELGADTAGRGCAAGHCWYTAQQETETAQQERKPPKITRISTKS